MQVAFMVVLIGVLVAAVVSFAVMGLLQHRRTNVLAGKAHRMGMRFSVEDPFDVPRRYADFARIASGHSASAHNVTYGRLGGLPVRAFDFRYEIGHGTRRTARHYGVVVIETSEALPPLVMWNDRDVECAPLASHQCDGHVACWAYLGPEPLAAAVGYACRALADRGAGMQAVGHAVMLCVPIRSRRQDYSDLMACAAAALQAATVGDPARTAGTARENPPATP